MDTMEEPAGFFSLHLNIQEQSTSSELNVKLASHLKRINSYKDIPIQFAVKNTIGFIYTCQSNYYEAEKKFEGILKEDPRNLNALANLEELCRRLKRTKDSKRYRTQLKDYSKYDACKARCLVEKGYIVAFDTYDVSYEVNYELSTNYFEQAIRTKGLSSEEIKTCHCFIGINYVRKYLNPMHQAEDYCQSFEHLFEATTSNNKKIQATCWSYLGNLVGYKPPADKIMEYQQLLQDPTSNTEIYQYTRSVRKLRVPQTLEKNSELKDYWYRNDYRGCFEKALTILPEDTDTLNKYAKVIVRKNKKKALALLHDSICFDPTESNWYAHQMRAQIYMQIGEDEYEEYKEADRIHNLQMAKDDFVRICNCTPDRSTQLGQLAQVYHLLSHYENPDSNMKLALATFTQALQKTDEVSSHHCKLLHEWHGNCLQEYDEQLQAIESYKRAVECSWKNMKLKRNNTMKKLVFLLRNKYDHTKHDKDLGELVYWVYVCKEKNDKFEEELKEYTSSIISLAEKCIARKNLDIADHFLDVIFSELHEEQKNRVKTLKLAIITEKHIMTLVEQSNDDRAKVSDEEQPSLSTLSVEDNLSETSCKQVAMQPNVEIQAEHTCMLSPLPQAYNAGFEYDFFVCHSPKDSIWVYYNLLTKLETGYNLKGCVEDRDFLPGESIINSRTTAIKKSYKVLAIVSKDFLNNDQCQHQYQQAMITREPGTPPKVIPIKIDDCTMPDDLALYTCIDVKKSYDWEKLERILKCP